ncbi:MAG TPA: ACP S-malonyltransferase, partial [Gemmatimonadota bacterium]|nr:ACP S-malonyltransferase [Gemmatimonadota bacterium]
GSMAAVLGLDYAAVETLCAAAREGDEVLVPANDNAPGQVVVSGSAEAVRRAVMIAREHGARKAVELNVSGAFHSPLMESAARALADELDGLEVTTARIPVVSNFDAEPVRDPTGIRARLLAQLTAPVRWVACVETLRGMGAREFLEPGPGAVLTRLLKRIDRGLEGRAVGEPADVEEVPAT